MVSLNIASAFAFVPSLSESGRTTLAALNHHPNNSCNDRRTFLVASAAASALPTLTTKSVAGAITPEQASESYDAYAATYDDLDGGDIASSLGIDEARRNLLGEARGDVLEIGVGTGLNLDSYRLFGPDTGIRSLTLVDISEGMLSRAESRVQKIMAGDDGKSGIPVKLVRADATSDLASLFGENKFDTVVDTFSLCVMGNEGAKQCLEEMTRVVKRGEDGGRILLIENTRASNPLLGFYQDVTASAAADIGGKGCLYNQNVGEMIRQTRGLKSEREEAFAAGLFRSFTCQKV